MRFSVLLADPPWSFRRSGDTRRTADSQYPTMSTPDLCAMWEQVDAVSESRSVLFLWATSATMPDALQVMRAWGYPYKTVAFVWHKLSPKVLTDRDLTRAVKDGEPVYRYGPTFHREHFGMGHYTRAGAEFCLLGARGGLEVQDRAVRQVIHAPVREHSRKPDEVYGLIERLYPRHAYLELFARSRRGGWAAFGNETDRFGVVA